ncbi:MAG TPA: molybdopterin-dependent oxidoreductase [Acidimicrobiales bacterium]|nr:molybdopterin-dependent oxidoreductase [Acidimicrobiales bacterium]
MPLRTPPRTRERTWRAALAGAVAAGAALAVGSVPAAMAGEEVDPVTAVGNEVVDRYAASLKDLAVSLFGQGDKVALVLGIVVVSLVLGAGLGVLALRRFALAAAGFAAFGAVGLWAHLTDPAGGTGVPVWSAVMGVAAGVGVLALLLQGISPWQPAARAPLDDPTVRTPPRRAFLAATGAAGGAAALVAVGAWSLRGRTRIDAQRASLVLPDPGRRTRVPDDGLVDAPGVSPYVTPNEDFYRIDTALVTPQVDVDSWRLRITGMVDAPFELTFDELVAMELVEEPVTLACVSNEVGGDLVGNAVWLGVPLATLLDRARVQPGATQIVGRSVDDFTVGFPTKAATDGRIALVAVGMNGEPLPAAHGYPARLVVAGLYGYVSATKWLTEIELTRLEDFDAFWIPRGWAKQAPVRTQSRIDVPRSGAEVAAGPVAVAGVAWAPDRGIRRVEVRVDDGPWEPARLGAVAGDATWVQWVHRWDAEPGEHVLRCRATDGTGETQPAERRPPAPDGATGHHAVRVRVQG